MSSHIRFFCHAQRARRLLRAHLYRGSALVRCPFSKAAYLPEHKGKLGICGLAEIGLEAPGLDENYVLER